MASLLAPIPLIRLYGGMTVKLEAIDATTGAPVSGVTVSAVAIYGRDLTGEETGAPLWEMYLLPRDV